jgi:hypothetical protein
MDMLKLYRIQLSKKSVILKNGIKTVLTPVSGLIEFHDENDNWVASIDFGDGECDEWATKTWDTSVFTEDTSGTSTFSVFEFKSKKE